VFNRHSRTFLPALLALAILTTTQSTRLYAQDRSQDNDSDDETKARLPLAIINFASVERLLGDMDYVFEAAGRPEISDFVGGLLANVRDFKGMDRDKPFGLMVFLDPGLGLIPSPVPIGFVPVTDIDEFMQTVSIGPVKMKAAAEGENRYELVGRGDKMNAFLSNGYLFVTRNADDLDRNFPSPEKVTQRLTSRFDIAASANLKSVPDATKEIFLNFLKIAASANLQKHDNEPEAAYQVRKANGDSWLEFTDLVIKYGESLTIGIKASKEKKQATIDIAIDATKDSKLAKHLKDIGGKRSYFAVMLDQPAPLTFSTAWGLGPSSQKTMNETIDAMEKAVTTGLNREQGVAAAADGKTVETPPSPITAGMFESLRETVKEGTFDMFAQFLGEPPKKMVLVGGLKIKLGHTFSASLTKLLQDPTVRNSPGMSELELNVASHKEIIIHRMRGDRGERASRQEEAIYGETPSFFVGAGPNAIWFALGGEDALTTLKDTIDKVAESHKGPPSRLANAPFRFTMHPRSWIDMAPVDQQGRFLEAVRAAFGKDDFIRVEFRPTETGGRTRIEFDEGFLRLIGSAIARRIEEREGL